MAETTNETTVALAVLDLRLVSQSELYTISHSHSTARNRRIDDDSVIPKIDRSVFNESAGSRKQTFSRLRLRKPNSSAPVPAPVPVSSSSRIADDEENSRIIDLLQGLFGVEALRGGNDDPLQIEYTPAVQNGPVDGAESSQRKRKRGQTSRGKTPVPEKPLAIGDATAMETATAVDEEKVEAVKEKNVLDDVGDPFVEELIKRTQGMNTEAQLMEFLEGLNGVWGSDRKKRRIVDANAVCGLLPTGWKLILILQRRGKHNSVVCRRYLSPDGRQFESYKDVSSYLVSLSGVQDISHLQSCYTDGSQQFSSNINVASANQNVGHIPTGGIKIDANASSRREKLPIISSSMGTGKRKVSDGNLNGDLAMYCELGNITSGAFTVFDHPTDVQLPLKAAKNGANSVQGCFLSEDRVYNQSVGHIPTGGMKIDAYASSHQVKKATMSSSIGTGKLNTSNRNFNSNLTFDRKLVLALKASDAACNPCIPLDLIAPISNSSCGIDRFSDERNAVTCIKGGVSNFDSQDKSTGYSGTVPYGKEQVHVGDNGLGVSSTLVENHIQKIGSESSTPVPNSEGKMFAGSNLEDSSLVGMEKNDGKLVTNDNQQIISSRYQPEIKDISTNGKLQFSSEGSLLPSQNEHHHTSIHSMDKAQTSVLKDSADGNFFYNDLSSSSIDERTWDPNGYINNISFSAWPQDASESGGLDFTPNLYVDNNVDHVPPTDEVARSCLQKRSSMNDQILTADNLLHRNSESNLLTGTGNQHPSAFHDNMNNISAGTFGALKHVDAGCMKPQLGIVSCSNVVAPDAYESPGVMQGRSESAPPVGNILNQFGKQNDDGVNKGNKSCLSEVAQSEAEIFQTDSMDRYLKAHYLLINSADRVGGFSIPEVTVQVLVLLARAQTAFLFYK